MFNSVRTEKVLGRENVELLKAKTVAVIGVGGVGGGAVEALARANIGRLIIVDGDVVVSSNLNRQICSLNGNIGQKKVKAMGDRVRAINDEIDLVEIDRFYCDGYADEFFSAYDIDYLIDAIDDVDAKVSLVLQTQRRGIPMISSMGTGNKKFAYLFEVGDIYSTSVCPLARAMRQRLKKEGVEGLKVIFSKEQPTLSVSPGTCAEGGVGSLPWVPPAVGMMMAGEAVLDIINK